MMARRIDTTNFGHTVEWLTSQGFDVLSANDDTVQVVRGDDWANDFQRLHHLIQDKLHILTCGGDETPMIKIAIGETIALSGLTDRTISEAGERWNRLCSERLQTGTRILAKGQPGKVERDNRHELLNAERVVWVKLDTQTTQWSLGFYPENIVVASRTGKTEQ